LYQRICKAPLTELAIQRCSQSMAAPRKQECLQTTKGRGWQPS